MINPDRNIHTVCISLDGEVLHAPPQVLHAPPQEEDQHHALPTSL